jgi:hypothetical protein
MLISHGDKMQAPKGDASFTVQSSDRSQDSVVTLPASATHSMLTKYKIHVRTSDVDGAGASGKVRIVLTGEFRAEELELGSSLNHANPFRRGYEDTFEFFLNTLGVLRSATVMLHDASGSEAAWHLREMEVIDTKCNLAYVFGCGQWIASALRNVKVLASSTVDGLNWISLRLKKPKQRPFEALRDLVLYKIHVRTSDLKGAGTDANVFLSITGALDSVQSLELKYDEDRADKFESGSEDVFEFHLPALGDIISVKVSRDNFVDFASAWHLQDVEIIDTTARKSFLFNCCQWLSKHEGPATIEKKYDSESNLLISLMLDKPEVQMLTNLYK